MTADPAQSAPSAEPHIHKHRCMRCDEEFDCKNPSQCAANYDVLGIHGQEHCPLQPNWDWIRAYAKRHAALRTAQLEREQQKLADFKTYVHKRLDAEDVPDNPEPEANQAHGCRIEGRLNFIFARAKTAESALRDAREKFVDEAVEYLKGMAKLYHRDNEHTAGSTLSKCAIGIRHALTVAAQTTEEK